MQPRIGPASRGLLRSRLLLSLLRRTDRPFNFIRFTRLDFLHRFRFFTAFAAPAVSFPVCFAAAASANKHRSTSRAVHSRPPPPAAFNSLAFFCSAAKILTLLIASGGCPSSERGGEGLGSGLGSGPGSRARSRRAMGSARVRWARQTRPQMSRSPKFDERRSEGFRVRDEFGAAEDYQSEVSNARGAAAGTRSRRWHGHTQLQPEGLAAAHGCSPLSAARYSLL